MPIYEYACNNCGHVFEMMQKITDKPKRKSKEPCEKCGDKGPITRLISRGGGFIFKGSGFYATDYRSSSYKEAEKKEKHNGPKDSPKKPDK